MNSILSLVVWLVVCFGAALLGLRFPPGAWYAGLRKPSWNPPNWIFGPVWTLLYILMAVAAWLVWENGGAANTGALALFLVQLILNAVWTWLFFGLHRPGLAAAEIVLLWLAILATTLGFWTVQPLAGLLLVPYLLWVSFAAILNFTVWRLNR